MSEEVGLLIPAPENLEILGQQARGIPWASVSERERAGEGKRWREKEKGSGQWWGLHHGGPSGL